MPFIIQGPRFDDEDLYWSNEYGWVLQDGATRFEDIPFTLPVETIRVVRVEPETNPETR